MIGETVTRLRRVDTGEVDRYGNPVYADDSTDLDGAMFAPGGSVEPAEVGREPVVTTPTLYFTRQVDVVSSDQLVVRGDTYQVTGRPATWVSPWTGETMGTVVTLELVEG